jgi:hypothetical protein
MAIAAKITAKAQWERVAVLKLRGHERRSIWEGVFQRSKGKICGDTGTCIYTLRWTIICLNGVIAEIVDLLERSTIAQVNLVGAAGT